MLEFGNKEFRNLQQQVAKNQCDISCLKRGIVISYDVDTSEQLSALITEENVGKYIYHTIEEHLYVIAKRNTTAGLDAVDLGEFPAKGPKGDTGDQGEQGIIGRQGYGIYGVSHILPDTSNYREGDWYLLDTGALYKCIKNYQGDKAWVLQCSLKGPQGIQGEDGDEVTANPSGTATDNLTKIKIDGIIYNLPGIITATDRQMLDDLEEYLEWQQDGSVEFAHDLYADGSIEAGTDVTVGRNLYIDNLFKVQDPNGNHILWDALVKKANLENGKVAKSELPDWVDDVQNITSLATIYSKVGDLPTPEASRNGQVFYCFNANQTDAESLQLAIAATWANGFLVYCQLFQGNYIWAYYAKLMPEKIYIALDTGKLYRFTLQSDNHLTEIGNGTMVVANPSPAGTTPLTGLQVGDDKYLISGGSTVSITAQDTDKIGSITVDGTTYQNIPFKLYNIEYSPKNLFIGSLPNTSSFIANNIYIGYDAPEYSTWIKDTIAIGNNVKVNHMVASNTKRAVAIGNNVISKAFNTIALGHDTVNNVDNSFGIDSSSLNRTIQLYDTTKIFFRNENVDTSKTTFAQYTNGKTLQDLLDEKKIFRHLFTFQFSYNNIFFSGVLTVYNGSGTALTINDLTMTNFGAISISGTYGSDNAFGTLTNDGSNIWFDFMYSGGSFTTVSNPTLITPTDTVTEL